MKSIRFRKDLIVVQEEFLRFAYKAKEKKVKKKKSKKRKTNNKKKFIT